MNSAPKEEIRVNQLAMPNDSVTGEFIDFDGERYYAVHNVDRMEPFFVSVISSDDHWLFVSSTGGLTAGRVSPDTALFPYVTVDKIHDSTPHTGCKTIIRVHGETTRYWEPFAQHHDRQYRVRRPSTRTAPTRKSCSRRTRTS